MSEYKEILNIIRETRNITLPSFGKALVIDKKSESAASIVTRIDQEVENFLAREFKKVRPDITYVGEEFGGDRTAKKYWLVDPVDGTGHYVRGIPYSTTMVSLIENGEVAFGAIYDFVNDILYHATKGQGAYANDEQINVSTRPVNHSYLAYETNLKKSELAINKYLSFRSVFTHMHHVCAGYEHVLVATGKIEGRIAYEAYGQDYDFAPGCLLIKEAGGIVTNIGSRYYDFKNTSYLATTPEVYRTLTEGVDALFPILD